MTEIIDLTFKLTHQGIHLIRNKYTFRLIAFHGVESVFLVKGRSVNNWPFIMAFGLFFLIIALFLLYLVLNGLWIEEKTVRFYNLFGHSLFAIMILGVGGMIAVYSAAKTVPVLQIKTNGNTYRLRVLKNKNNLTDIFEFFSSHGVKVES